MKNISSLLILFFLTAGCKVSTPGARTNDTPFLPSSSEKSPIQTELAVTESSLSFVPVEAYPTLLDGMGLELLLDGWQGLMVYDIDNRRLLPLEMHGGRFPLVWEWSPDGSLLLLAKDNLEDMSTDITYYLLDPSSNIRSLITTLPDPGFLWHPNSKAILVHDQFLDPKSGNVLVSFQAPQWLFAAFSPDGRQVVFADYETNRFLQAEVQLDESGQVIGISPLLDLGMELVGELDDVGERQNPPIAFNMIWEPNGDQIAMFLLDPATRKGKILLLNPMDGSMENLAEGFGENQEVGFDAGSLSWSPDGNRLTFSTYEIGGPDHRVFMYDFSEQVFLEITGGEFPSGQNPFWVPDAEAVIFMELVSDRLVVSRLDGSEKQLLGDEIQAYFGGFRP